MLIPRNIAFRAWAACLGSQAQRLRRLASDRGARESVRAHGPGAAANNRDKHIGRIERADRLADFAYAISGWIDDPAHRGPDLDPTLVSMVVCYLYGHAASLPELRRWAGHRGHAGRIDHADPADVPAYLERLLEVR